VIVDLERYVKEEKAYWEEFEGMLNRMTNDPDRPQSLDEIRRFHYLYQRTASTLSQLQGSSHEPDLIRYLESLVARAFGEVHEIRTRADRFTPLKWFFQTFPQVFRRQRRMFMFALLVSVVGALFGAAIIALDPGSKEVLMPFGHLLGDPSDRVAKEESQLPVHLDENKGRFSSYLMTHNTKVSIFCMALGITWGVGTLILLFYNGVILGAIFFDYIQAGQTEFLLGWLLPHGVIEIPAILIAGQAGLLLAGTLINRQSGLPFGLRLREKAFELTTLIGGVAVLLVWAGVVEAFISQYHQPVLPYSLKIAFGLLELAALIVFLSRSGLKAELQQQAMES
jgi:uncharacterized membrane protein SpoIIM required for sporulation